jgi:RIO kinase 1
MGFEELAYDGYYVSDVLAEVKSGKEATVFCCKAQEHTGLGLVAVKVYRPLESRGYRNDATYQEGRYMSDARLRRAYRKKSKAGKTAQFSNWISSEYETMALLFSAGADIPRPYNMTPSAIIMEYIGNFEQSASTLNRVYLRGNEPNILFEKILHNISVFLSVGRVHADLSPFNVLYWESKIRIIDFPQAVDPYSNRNAFSLLVRDVTLERQYRGHISFMSDLHGVVCFYMIE